LVRDWSFWLDGVVGASDELRREEVDSLAVVVVGLQGVAVGQPSLLVDRHSPAPFPTQPILVIYIHELLTEVALVHVEVEAVHGDEFWQQDVLDLVLLSLDVVPEHKPPLL